MLDELSDAVDRRLGMKLQREDAIAIGECLILARLAARQSDGASRDRERLTVPVERVEPGRQDRLPPRIDIEKLDGCQPISLCLFRTTWPPRPSARSCAPRQMPHIRLPLARAWPISFFSAPSQGIAAVSCTLIGPPRMTSMSNESRSGAGSPANQRVDAHG
jgi:hypothetical protein